MTTPLCANGGARLAALLLALTGATGPAAAIVGGQPDGEPAPYTVMVLWRDGRQAGFCSGVVVAQDAVLTAAHCVPAGADVAAHYKDGSAPVLAPVSIVTRHPDYRSDAIRSRQRSVDLAVLRLKTPLPARFRAATLGGPGSGGTATGTPFRVAGFGLSTEQQATTGGTLRSVTLQAEPPLSGLLLWARDPHGTGGACTGDSGGPVLDASGDVVAVIAWAAGHGGTGCGDLTQAVWIGPYRAWIAQAAGAARTP